MVYRPPDEIRLAGNFRFVKSEKIYRVTRWNSSTGLHSKHPLHTALNTASINPLRTHSTSYQLVKIKGIEIDFKASGDPRSKLWHVLFRLLIVTTPYHSQLSGTKGADHLESAWDEDLLWVKVAWIFSGIACCLQTRLYSRRFSACMTTKFLPSYSFLRYCENN